MESQSESDDAFETGSESSFDDSLQYRRKTVIYRCGSFKNLSELCKALGRPLNNLISHFLQDMNASHLKMRLSVTTTYRDAHGKSVNRRLTSDAYTSTDETDIEIVVFLLLNPILNEHYWLTPNESIVALHSAMVNLIPTDVGDEYKTYARPRACRCSYEV